MRNVDYIKFDEKQLVQRKDSDDSDTGFLSMLANITRTGVFTYYERSPDGTIRIIRQLRHPEEVFHEQAMETLLGLPLTNQHPEELVSTENARDYMVGMTSDRPKRIKFEEDNEDYVQQKITIFDEESIKMVIDGERREMSLGYTCELENSSGEWNGERYDCIQRNISYNHLSLVDRARGGPECKIILDGNEVNILDQQNIVCDGLSFKDDNKENKVMKTFVADGKSYEVSDDVYEILNANANKLKNLDSLNEKLEKSEAQKDELSKQLDSIKNKDDSDKEAAKIAKAVSAKVALVSKATKVLDSDEDLSLLNDREIHEKVIKHIHPDVNLDGKSDAYVEARFDIVSDNYKKPEDENKLGNSLNRDSGGDKPSYKEAREKAWNRDKDLYKSTKNKN